MKNKELLDDSYSDPQNHKVKITTYIDGDILLELKTRAKIHGGKYQSYLNKILRDALFVEKEGLEQKVNIMWKMLNGKVIKLGPKIKHKRSRP